MPHGTIRPDYLSPSSVKSYLSCSARFYMEKVLGIHKPISPALHVGLSVHEAIRTFHLLRWNRAEYSIDRLRKSYFSAFLEREHIQKGVEYRGDNRFRHKNCLNGWKIVQAFLLSPEAKTGGLPRGVEVSLQMEVPGLHPLITGTIDLVQGDGGIVDYKTCTAVPNLHHALFEHEIQLVTYQLLMQDAGERVSSLSLVYLTKTKTPRIIRINGSLADKKRQQRVLSLYKSVYEGITSERFIPQPGMHCSWCPYTRECMTWTGT